MDGWTDRQTDKQTQMYTNIDRVKDRHIYTYTDKCTQTHRKPNRKNLY